MRSSIGKIVALVVTGFGIGWLAGLSVSPVVSIVITSVTGSVATIVAALSGVNDELLDRETSPNTVRRWLNGVTPVPLAWLVVGLIVGSVIGICVRTHNWLSPSPPVLPTISDEVDQWVNAGLSDRAEVARRLFESRYAYRGWLGTDLSSEIKKWSSAGISETVVINRLFESTYPTEMRSGTVVQSSSDTISPTAIPTNQPSVLYDNVTSSCGRLAIYLKEPLLEDEIKDFNAETETTLFRNLVKTITEPEMRRQALAEICHALKSSTE